MSVTFVDHMSSPVSSPDLEEVDVHLLSSDQVSCVLGMCELRVGAHDLASLQLSRIFHINNTYIIFINMIFVKD